jgi:hypothetical protein
VGASFEVVDLPPEIYLLSLYLVDGLLVLMALSCEWRRLQGFRVKDPSGARKGGLNRPPEWAGPAGLGRPAQAHFGPVRSPLHSRGSSGDYALCPFHFMILTMSSSRQRWRFSLHEVRSFTLMNTNKTP